MSAILLGSSRVIFRNPMLRNGHTHEWWAEGGLIHWRDTVTNEFGSQTVHDTLLRLKGLNDMIGNSRTNKGANTPEEMAYYRTYIDDMVKQCELARYQGMPNDPKHAMQIRREVQDKRKSRMIIRGSSHW